MTLLLAWRRHGQEMELSPEGTARHLLDWHGEIASYESETRRLSLQWEFQAEERRQAAQDKAAEHARQLAQMRIDELDARRKAIEAQRAQADPYAVQWRTESPQTAIDGAGCTETALQVQSIDDDANDVFRALCGKGRWLSFAGAILAIDNLTVIARMAYERHCRTGSFTGNPD